MTRCRAPENEDTRREEPRTVPEAQRQLNQLGWREWTEADARNLLKLRRLVREGKLIDDN